MRRLTALSISVGLVAVALVWCSSEYLARAAGQNGQRLSAPVYIGWPLPATGKAYDSIDGKHLWQYVKEQSDIAERYRDQGHPQFWGRIAGTSSDVEDVQWLLGRYRQIGLSDVHAQTVAFFHPQWAPDSWEVTAKTAGKTMKLTTAQPPYGAVSTDGKVLDLPAAYIGLGSDADFNGRDVRGKGVLFLRNQFTYNIGPADVLKRAEDRGAAAVLVSDLRGGNLTVQAYRADTDRKSVV